MLKLIKLFMTLLLISGALQAQTSEQVRAQKDYFVGWTPFGVHLPTYITRPFEAGYYINKDWSLSLEYGSVGYDAEFFDHEASGSYSNLGMKTRYFWANTFNTLLALHKRTFTVNGITYVNGSETSAKLVADATVASVGVGNQWMFDFGLTLGVDWAVGSYLISSSSDAKVEHASLTESEKTSREKELEDLGEAVNLLSAFPGFFILSASWAF